MNDLRRSLLASIWFMFLTFPIMGVKVNTTEKLVEWRWMNVLWVGIGAFVLSWVWRVLMERRKRGGHRKEELGDAETGAAASVKAALAKPSVRNGLKLAVAAVAIGYPLLANTYQINIVAQALIYVGLGLGLNIIVGMAGLLNLGYAAFYAVGAYTYALLNHNFHLGFWTVLPLGGVMAALFGVLIALPVLRLRGDYLAIVTLGFGEIMRLMLENWGTFTHGPSGIANIDRPSFFGMEFSIHENTMYIYYILVGMIALTIFVIGRVQNSRIGRALVALREDEIACQAMGIDKTKVKLIAFALGATWAGFLGVIFAAKQTFINPASFTFLESAMILAIVVLGGMGSIWGVVMAALILQLLPEYLRAFSDYRMLIFGATMVLMMIFRPQGLVSMDNVKTEYPLLRKLMQGGAK